MRETPAHRPPEPVGSFSRTSLPRLASEHSSVAREYFGGSAARNARRIVLR